MKNLNIVKVIGFIVFFYSQNVFADPILLFSDLTSGPNSGWSSSEPNKGAAVTIFGRNFGNDKGSSFVTVNGVKLESSSDYPAVWGKTNDPIPWLQTISFHLNSGMPTGSGEISVTVNGTKSEAIPFTIRDGDIYFVDVNSSGGGNGSFENPWNTPANFFSQEKPGDTLYFRGGTYPDKYLTGKQNLYLSGQTNGTESEPIALVGFPGEVAIFDTIINGSSSLRGGIESIPSWYTIARLHFNARSIAISSGNYNRLVGNNAEGAKVFLSGSATIVTNNSGNVVLGNTSFGAETNNKLDHGLYITGCPSEKGAEVAHNYIYNNRVDRGPYLVVNHQDDRCSSTEFVKSHYIHSNVIDCSNGESRGIGVYHQSWDGDGETEPETTYVHNNILIACGTSGYPAMYNNAAHTSWVNNTLIDSKGMGFQNAGGRVLTTQFVNNIVHMAGTSYPYIDVQSGITDFSNNIYFDGMPGTEFGNAAILSDPNLEIDTNLFMFSLGQGSPAIDAGEDNPLTFQVRDFYGEGYSPSSRDIGATLYSLRIIPKTPSGVTTE